MDYAEAARRFDAAIDLDQHNVPAYLNLGDVRFYQGDTAGAIAAWERLIETVAGARVPGVLAPRSRLPEARRGGPLPGPVPPPDCRDAAGLARPARARPPPLRSRLGRRGAGAALRSAGPQPARARAAPGDLADAVAARSAAGTGRPLRRADARRGLLPRPAHLHPLPLPQHRAALAVPALPRVEHVHRGADRAGEGIEAKLTKLKFGAFEQARSRRQRSVTNEGTKARETTGRGRTEKLEGTRFKADGDERRA